MSMFYGKIYGGGIYEVSINNYTKCHCNLHTLQYQNICYFVMLKNLPLHNLNSSEKYHLQVGLSHLSVKSVSGLSLIFNFIFRSQLRPSVIIDWSENATSKTLWDLSEYAQHKSTCAL